MAAVVSLVSLDLDRAVRELFRVVAPGAAVTVLEHAALEAVLPAAVHAACVRKYGDGVKLAPARRLRGA